MTDEIKIDRLGHRGDGIAQAGDGELYVPFTLPGETVRVQRTGNRAELVEIVDRSPDRIAPVCGHFGHCGGCQVQHLSGDRMLEWKRGLVVDALATRGIECPVEAIEPMPVGNRRRAVFTAARRQGKLIFGFHGRASNGLVDIEECPVLTPRLAGALPSLRRLAGVLAPQRGELRISVLLTQNGPDVRVDPPKGARMDRRAQEKALALAVELGFARLSLGGEILIETAPPAISFGQLPVTPPPGGFVQASLEGEKRLTGLVLEALGDARTVADLFCGCGTFTLPTARKARVTAVETDRASLDALDKAARKATGLRPIDIQQRDLFRRPLQPKELEKFDAVIFDPPRVGAADQARELGSSKVPLVIAVSCNPATLARDLATLREGGYEIERITPVDQFVFSHHVEAVAICRRARRAEDASSGHGFLLQGNR